jgi:NADH dehydrogenase [ubiquinone] 1 alpha subcomplex assembly factor 7
MSPIHNNDTAMSFSSHRQKHTASKKNKKKGNQDVYKQQLKSSSQSIVGKRPGQTAFSPPKDKTLSSAQTSKPTMQQSSPKRPIKQSPMPLILPPSVSQTTQQPISEHDNKDYAHTHPSASAITLDANDGTDSPLRNLFLKEGILPPPPRPVIDKSRKRTTDQNNGSSSPKPIIPEPDPSGVSHANAEDILDMASMYEPSIHLPDKPDFNSPANRIKYEAGTPMTDELIAYIGVRGPITVAEFVRRVLRDGAHGYYTSKGSRSGKKNKVGAAEGGAGDTKDIIDGDDDWDLDEDNVDAIHASGDSTHVGGEHVIGSGGDFITAPEVSQLFGESLLVWLMTQYQTLNSPSKIQLIEIGPGKGTLICDIVRSAISTFPDFASALTSSNSNEEQLQGMKKVTVGVHLVEVANGMRARQKESLEQLGKEHAVLEKGYAFQFADGAYQKKVGDQPSAEPDGSSINKDEQENIICFSWHDVLSSVPTHDAATGEPIPTFIVCQELVDALPIHSFQKIDGGVWRERLVDVAIRDESEATAAAKDIRLAVARRYASAEPSDGETTSSSDLASTSTQSASETNEEKIPRLRFVLPPDTTPALRTILRVNNRGSPIEDNPTAQSLDSLPVGSIIEACPEGLLLVQDIADRIEKCHGGAALIIDYGGDGSSGGDTLRGFWKHTQVHPLSRPGEVDVTADVDFGALREAVNRRVGLEESLERKRKQSTNKPSALANNTVEEKNPEKSTVGPEAFGPICQGKFLAQMGIVQRVETKILDDTTTDEDADEIFLAMERLMAEDQMGERYKVLAIAAKKDGLFPPPGF